MEGGCETYNRGTGLGEGDLAWVHEGCVVLKNERVGVVSVGHVICGEVVQSVGGEPAEKEREEEQEQEDMAYLSEASRAERWTDSPLAHLNRLIRR